MALPLRNISLVTEVKARDVSLQVATTGCGQFEYQRPTQEFLSFLSAIPPPEGDRNIGLFNFKHEGFLNKR